MKRDDAIELANHWNDLAGHDPNVGPSYTALQRAARQLLPDDVPAAGAAVVDGVPTMLALSGGGLFLARAIADDNGRSVIIRLRRLPVVADQMTVELVDGLVGKRGGQDALTRLWSFAWPDGTSVEFESCTRSYGWNDGPDSAEVVALALAAAIGWAIPSGDG